MDQTQRDDSGGLADSIDREQLGHLVASHQPQPLTSAIPTRSRTRWIPLTLILTVFLLIAAAASLLLFWRRSGLLLTPQQPVPGPTRPYPPPSVKHEMIVIPGGTLTMGRNDGPPAEAPVHSVIVGSFLLDNTEVTRAEYAVFVEETKHPAPDDWAAEGFNQEQGQLPVVNVSFEDAVAFAAWRSKRDGANYRLPTEVEWEYAARNGDKNNLYPWGNTWQPGRAAIQEADVANAVAKEQPVGSYPQGANQWGVNDLIGNVWEWTSTKASLYPGSTLKFSEQFKDWIVARGGSYGTPATRVNATMRDWFPPTKKHKTLGFRLARSVQ